MRTAYLDLFSGISGDMFIASCIDAGLPIVQLSKELSGLRLSGYSLGCKKIKKGVVSCSSFKVSVRKDSHERSIKDIASLIRKSKLSAHVKENSIKVFDSLATAEAKIHGIDRNKVHFHEVGAIDSIVDIVGACIALELMEIEKLYFSKIPIGQGSVKIAHGRLPLPAPATLELLKNMETYFVDIEGELVTPTGAAILKTLGEQSYPPSDYKIMAVGYGAGDMDIPERPNFTRILIFQGSKKRDSDVVFVLETNLDDTTGEEIGFLQEKLFSSGALDVFTTPIYMKKSRPGVKLTAIVPVDKYRKIEKLIFSFSGTFGIRRYLVERTKLVREEKLVKTKYGRIRVKYGYLGEKIAKRKPEYEDLCRVGKKLNLPLGTIEKDI